MKTPISTLLSEKKNCVFSVSPNDTVQVAVLVMNHHHIGSVMVVDEGKLVGMFTERDVLQRIVAGGLDASIIRISQVMTQELTTITPATDVNEALELITTRRLRHLPVIEDGNLVGSISIGDIMRFLSDSLEMEVGSLWSYITGDNSLEVADYQLTAR